MGSFWKDFEDLGFIRLFFSPELPPHEGQKMEISSFLHISVGRHSSRSDLKSGSIFLTSPWKTFHISSILDFPCTVFSRASGDVQLCLSCVAALLPYLFLGVLYSLWVVLRGLKSMEIVSNFPLLTNKGLVMLLMELKTLTPNQIFKPEERVREKRVF